MRTAMSAISLFGAAAFGAAALAGDCGSTRTASSQSTCPHAATTMTVKAGDTCQASGRDVMLTAMASKDIVDTAVSAGNFQTLVAAVKAAGLADVLKGDGPFTVLAPTDDAFAKLGTHAIQDLLKPENRPVLQAILTYHVVPGKVMAKDAMKLNGATTVNGQRIALGFEDGGVTVDGANVIATDIACSNGVIHVIDSVIMPSRNDLVATAVNAGSFQTLAAALKAAKLVSTLQGDGPFTVFAPTDEAFAKLPGNTVQDLLKPENRDALTAVLTYHVVPGRIYAEDAVRARRANTVLGAPVRISIQDGRLMVNGARIIKTDIDATNGVIHVIDSVILPAASPNS